MFQKVWEFTCVKLLFLKRDRNVPGSEEFYMFGEFCSWNATRILQKVSESSFWGILFLKRDQNFPESEEITFWGNLPVGKRVIMEI